MLKTMTDGKIPEFCHVRNRNQTSQHSLSASLSEVLDNGLYKHDTSVPTVFQRTRNHEHTNFTHESSPEIDSFAAYIRTHDLSFDSSAAHRDREAAFADIEGHPALAYMLAHYRGPATSQCTINHEHTIFTHESSPEIGSFAHWQLPVPATASTPILCPTRTARDSLFAAYIRTHDLSFDSATAYREREAAFADTEGHPALAYMLAHYRGPGLLRVEYENEAAGAWRRVRQRTRAVMKGFRGGRWRLWKAG